MTSLLAAARVLSQKAHKLKINESDWEFLRCNYFEKKNVRDFSYCATTANYWIELIILEFLLIIIISV